MIREITNDDFDGRYGGKVYGGFNPDMFFEKLGIELGWEKIRYYIGRVVLDEYVLSYSKNFYGGI